MNEVIVLHVSMPREALLPRETVSEVSVPQVFMHRVASLLRGTVSEVSVDALCGVEVLFISSTRIRLIVT